jgi:hypothetical protein
MVLVYVFPDLVTWLPESLYSQQPAAPGAPTILDAPPAGGFMEQEEISLPPLN